MTNTKRKIFQSIIKMFLVLFIIILISVIYKFYDNLSSESIKKEMVKNQILAEICNINRVIESLQRLPQDLAYILEFVKIDEEKMIILLESVLFNNNELYGSAIAFEPYFFDKDSLYFAPFIYMSGDTFTYTNLNHLEYDYFKKDWYLVTKTLREPTWSEPYYDKGKNILMLLFSVPFYSFDGVDEKFGGIVTVAVSTEWIKRTVNSLKKIVGGDLILISEDGIIISAPVQKWIYHETIFSIATEKNLPVLREIGKDLQKGKSGFVFMGNFEDYKNIWVCYSSIQLNKWGVLFLVPENELFKN